LTVVPSKRFTVDDIAAHWWVNLGYKYPPVHYYLTPAMRENGLPMPSHVPALTYNERTKPPKTIAEAVPKVAPPIAMPPRVPPLLPTQNGHLTDTQSKAKPSINGYHSVGRSHRLTSNAVTAQATNHMYPALKFNQPHRRTSVERNHDGGVFSPKLPLPRTMIY
jgi:hypothetical protein